MNVTLKALTMRTVEEASAADDELIKSDRPYRLVVLMNASRTPLLPMS